jgi:hypothetical protein
MMGQKFTQGNMPAGIYIYRIGGATSKFVVR